MGQKEKWTPLTSLLCCMAYVQASMDPKRGNAQKAEAFASRVRKVYNRLLNEYEKKGEVFDNATKERTSTAVVQRYRKVKESCIKFEEHRQRVEAMNLTGNLTEEDFIRITTASFNGNCTLNGMNRAHVYRYTGVDAASPGKVYIHLK